MELSLFSWPDTLEGEIALTKACIHQGLSVFHLRKPNWSYQQTEAFLKGLTAEEQATVILHQHPDLRLFYPIKGIHFSSYQPLKRYGHIFPEEPLSFSTSVHSLSEANELPEGFSMVYISPVFDSISKSNHFSIFDKSSLEAFLKNKSSKARYYALGGIDEHNIQQAAAIGFGGAGVLGAVWHTFQRRGHNAALSGFRSLMLATKTSAYGRP